MVSLTRISGHWNIKLNRFFVLWFISDDWLELWCWPPRCMQLPVLPIQHHRSLGDCRRNLLRQVWCCGRAGCQELAVRTGGQIVGMMHLRLLPLGTHRADSSYSRCGNMVSAARNHPGSRCCFQHSLTPRNIGCGLACQCRTYTPRVPTQSNGNLHHLGTQEA